MARFLVVLHLLEIVGVRAGWMQGWAGQDCDTACQGAGESCSALGMQKVTDADVGTTIKGECGSAQCYKSTPTQHMPYRAALGVPSSAECCFDGSASACGGIPQGTYLRLCCCVPTGTAASGSEAVAAHETECALPLALPEPTPAPTPVPTAAPTPAPTPATPLFVDAAWPMAKFCPGVLAVLGTAVVSQSF